MSNKSIAVYAEALKRSQKEEIQQPVENKESRTTSKVTRKSTQTRDLPLDKSREISHSLSSDIPRALSRELPTRDEIQEFSFRLRDTLKVKLQAEVPHEWQVEIEDIASELNVKKLELYRFIYGQFLEIYRKKKKI